MHPNSRKHTCPNKCCVFLLPAFLPSQRHFIPSFFDTPTTDINDVIQKTKTIGGKRKMARTMIHASIAKFPTRPLAWPRGNIALRSQAFRLSFPLNRAVARQGVSPRLRNNMKIPCNLNMASVKTNLLSNTSKTEFANRNALAFEPPWVSKLIHGFSMPHDGKICYTFPQDSCQQIVRCSQ